MVLKSPEGPLYRLHKATGQARVILDGKHVYLGRFNSPESLERYHRLSAEWHQSHFAASAPAAKIQAAGEANSQAPGITVNRLIYDFWQYAKGHYVKHGKPTSELASYQTVLKPVRQMFGSQAVTAFGPMALVQCRQYLIDANICRNRINSHMVRLRRVFKWGVSRELVPETVWRALKAVEGLRRGEALERPPIKPVPEEHIAVIRPHVTPQVWAMVQLQLATGCRPGEICVMRTCDLKTDGAIWEYRPWTHKTEHQGKERVIFLGPQAQAVLRPWLKTELSAYVFSPREARAWMQELRKANRKTPRRKQEQRRPRKTKPQRAPGEFYPTTAYEHAIRRGCIVAGVPAWAPNRLRHNAGTRIRAEFGIEAARIILGHSSAVTSEIYAEIDREKAQQIMGRLG